MLRSFFFLLFLPLFSIGQSWDQVSNFIGDGRHHPITFSNDQYGFVVAGSYMNDVYRYEKATNTWIQLQDFPALGRGYSYGVAVGNKAYMGLGSTSNGLYPNDWWEYDMSNDTWLQKADLPTQGRNHPAMIAVDNKIYMGCGSNDNGNLGDWWEYDIINNMWTQKTDFPGNDRHHPFYFDINNQAYVGFGHGSIPGPGTNPSSNSYIYNDFYKYNPNNDTWTQLSNFPSEARVAGTQFSYNGKGYVLSGDGDNHGPLDSGEFWEYNPLNDSWTQLPSHPGGAIWAPGCFVIDCSVYFLLGQDWNTTPSTDPISVYKYKINTDCGCTDSLAYNFSNLAIFDDGSCCYVSGCTDPLSINYDSLACYDDNSCIAAVLGCTNPNASNYNSFANTNNTNGGALDNTIGSGGYFYNNQHLLFNSTDECIIKSACFYAESSNMITFELRSTSGVILDDTTHFVTSGKQRLDLNFNVPVGNNLQLGVTNNSGLYRNNTGSNYPYNIGDMVNITNSSAGGDYYYFYYDIEVESKCVDISSVFGNQENYEKKIIKITDVLGRESEIKNNTPLFYLYEDGTVKRKIIFE